jgi:hypothetical protein
MPGISASEAKARWTSMKSQPVSFQKTGWLCQNEVTASIGRTFIWWT